MLGLQLWALVEAISTSKGAESLVMARPFHWTLAYHSSTMSLFEKWYLSLRQCTWLLDNRWWRSTLVVPIQDPNNQHKQDNVDGSLISPPRPLRHDSPKMRGELRLISYSSLQWKEDVVGGLWIKGHYNTWRRCKNESNMCFWQDLAKINK